MRVRPVVVQSSFAAFLGVCLTLLGEIPDLPRVGSPGGPSRAFLMGGADRWLSGRELFRHGWSPHEGLGAPGFNAASCGECHTDPALGGAGGREHDVVSLGRGGGYDLRAAGPGNAQTHPRRLLAKAREVEQRLQGRDRRLLLEGALPPSSAFRVRQTPSLLGLGLVDGIPDDAIRANADPTDRDGDGVRGIASVIAVGERIEVGRFGWQADVPHLADFVCQALGGETGVTAPDQGRGFGLTSDRDDVADPELSQVELDDLAFYVGHLAPPARGRRGDRDAILRGETLFASIGCATCHVPALPGRDGPVQLYSDLLLHDVLPADEVLPEERRGRPVPSPLFERAVAIEAVFHPDEVEEVPVKQVLNADPRLFRTAPLWGVSRTAPYFHDGRADTLADAILAHDGEACASRERYEQLDEVDQEALLAFLRDL